MKGPSGSQGQPPADLPDSSSLEEPDVDNIGQQPSDQQMGDQPSDPADQSPENENGMIRRVQGAHLVYKRKQEDGTFEELWIYKIGKDSQRNDYEIRQDILAGTDIPKTQTSSEDGEQHYDLWTCGNAQILRISGLKN